VGWLACYRAGRASLALADRAAARAAFEQAAAADPAQARPAIFLAELRLDAGDPVGARADLSRWLDAPEVRAADAHALAMEAAVAAGSSADGLALARAAAERLRAGAGWYEAHRAARFAAAMRKASGRG
jgi:hypothetical protein